MPLSKITAILSVAAIAVTTTVFAQTLPTIVVNPAIATMTVDQLVETRQDHMKQNGRLLRSAGGLVGDDAVAAATTILQNFTDFPALFPEGSINSDSKALPVIWEQWDQFEGIIKTAQVDSTKMLEAAMADDPAAYQAAIDAIARSCGTCHQTFRGR